jgi:hypothetical protein
MNCKFHWVNPNSWEGWGAMKKKNMADDGTTESWIRFLDFWLSDFWPIHLAI